MNYQKTKSNFSLIRHYNSCCNCVTFAAIEKTKFYLCILLLTPILANANTIEQWKDETGSVQLVREPSDLCTSGYQEHFQINGLISLHMSNAVRLMLPKTKPCVDRKGMKHPIRVHLTSFGGRASAGYRMGELFYQFEVQTVVNSKCYSSCGIAFLGGVKRYLSPNADLLLHNPYVVHSSVIDCDNPYQSDKLKDYLAKTLGKKTGENAFKHIALHCSDHDGWHLNTERALEEEII